MSDNFVFDGRHSLDDMGLYTGIITRPLFAEPKTVYEDIPGTDGELNFNISNPKKRMCFKPRIIELECHFAGEGETRADYIHKISELAAWLATGENKKLTFDDEDGIYYMAHAANLFNIEHITAFSGTFPLVFKCEPFRYKTMPVSISGTGSVAYENTGFHTPPNIYVTGTAAEGFTVTNSANGKSLIVNVPLDGATAVISNGDMTVMVNGVSVLHQCEGDFFELPAGAGTITVSGDADVPLSVQVKFTERYL